MAGVCLERVCKRYDRGRFAVDEVSLEVADGEFLVLVGPSGCGKSTLLRLVAGLEEASSGEIRIGGRRVNETPPKDRDIAMVFQNYALYPHMTVWQNMAFGLRLRRLPRREIEARVAEAAELLGLSELLERLPKQLSGGQRQRVAVGRAIVRKPSVFLFDEPLSNLDAKMRLDMRGEIHRLHRRLGATMLYVTHDQTEAMTLGDRVAVMERGVLQQVARPLEVYRSPQNLFVAGFIGTPPISTFRGRLVRRDAALWFEHEAVSWPLEGCCAAALAACAGREVVAGLRAEAFELGAGGGAGLARLSASVEVLEPMGSETLVYLQCPGAGRVVARGAPGAEPAVGTVTDVGVRVRQAHYFDGASGARVGGGVGEGAA